MALELVTGYQGVLHVTAAQDSDLHRGIIGGNYIMSIGNKMTPEIVTSNEIKINDGICVCDGREFYIGYGDSETVEIASGTSGMKRNDIIVIQYDREESTGVESAKFVAIQGTPGSEATDPAYSDMDIRTEAFESQKAFCRVRLDGVNIEGIDMLMNVMPPMSEIATTADYSGAGVHNAIYRGKYLGDHVTDEQWNEIKAGTFDDLYIGDYWTIDGVNWRIAAFDYYINTGSTYYCTDHHIVLVPEERLYTAQMNTSSTTTGGYAGSAMFTTNLADAKTAVNNAFGSGHILKHEVYRTNAVTSGYPSAGEWLDITVDLMNEEMVFGCPIRQQMSFGGTRVYGGTVEKSQLPLFGLAPEFQNIKLTYWLRDIYSASTFCCVSSLGLAGYASASSTYGVLPAFCIYAS